MKHTHNLQSPTQKILRLAIPMTSTQVLNVGSGFICMTMLSKLGHLVLAASALIFSVSLTVFVTSVSLLFSLSILVGHAYGRQDNFEAGSLWQQGRLLALLISIPCMVVYWYIYPILLYFGQDPQVSAIAKTYFHAAMWGFLPALLAVCNQQLCYGVHKQKLDLTANIMGVVILLLCSYLFIFGKLGLPKLGAAGYGYAQVIQCISYFLFTTFCFYKFDFFKSFELFKSRLRTTWPVLRNLFKIGWPIGLQISGEMLSFIVCAAFMGWLGTVSLAAYQIMMQYEFLSVIPVFALSQACGVLIGQAVGSQHYTDIKKMAMGCLGITSIFCFCVAAILLLFPKPLAALYLNVHDPRSASTLHLVIQLFMVMAVSQFLDGIRNILLGALRGLLDTRFAMIVGLLTIWIISVPLGYLFAFPLHGGAVGAMLGWALGMLISISIFWRRWCKVVRTFS